MTGNDNAELRHDLARLSPYGLASVALFAFGALGGGLAIILSPDTSLHLQDLLKQFAKIFQGMPRLQLAAAIFFNNSVKTLLVILLGPLLGLAPVLFLLVNGAILGAVIPVAVESRGLWTAIMTILPHGILELPAIFLGTSIGISLGLHPLARLRGKTELTLFSELGHALRIYLSVIIPLLLIAAAVEVFVTPLVAGL